MRRTGQGRLDARRRGEARISRRSRQDLREVDPQPGGGGLGRLVGAVLVLVPVHVPMLRVVPEAERPERVPVGLLAQEVQVLSRRTV